MSRGGGRRRARREPVLRVCAGGSGRRARAAKAPTGSVSARGPGRRLGCQQLVGFPADRAERRGRRAGPCGHAGRGVWAGEAGRPHHEDASRALRDDGGGDHGGEHQGLRDARGRAVAEGAVPRAAGVRSGREFPHRCAEIRVHPTLAGLRGLPCRDGSDPDVPAPTDDGDTGAALHSAAGQDRRVGVPSAGFGASTHRDGRGARGAAAQCPGHGPRPDPGRRPGHRREPVREVRAVRDARRPGRSRPSAAQRPSCRPNTQRDQ